MYGQVMARNISRGGRTLSLLLVFTTFASLGAAAPARADDDCPDHSRADAKTKRLDAKRFFDRAQKAQAAGEETEALRAYQCSLTIVSHPFTAFNVARLADKRGDAETALSAYRLYLDLATEAPDRAQVATRIEALQAQLDAAARAVTPANPTDRDTAAREVAPPVPMPPSPEAPATPIAEREPPTERSAMRVAGWVLTGTGAVALAAGIALNLMARDDMNTCRARYAESMTNPGALPAAEAACDSARPLAYSSYAALGVGAAAAAAGITLWTIALRQEGQSQRERAVAWVTPTAGGAVIAGRLPF